MSHFSHFGLTVWPTIANIYTNIQIYIHIYKYTHVIIYEQRDDYYIDINIIIFIAKFIILSYLVDDIDFLHLFLTFS